MIAVIRGGFHPGLGVKHRALKALSPIAAEQASLGLLLLTFLFRDCRNEWAPALEAFGPETAMERAPGSLGGSAAVAGAVRGAAGGCRPLQRLRRGLIPCESGRRLL